MEDTIKIVGEVFCYESKDGKKWKLFDHIKNLFTLKSHANIIDAMIGNTFYELNNFAVGDGTTVPTKTSTLIDGEYARYEIDIQDSSVVDDNQELQNTLILDYSEGIGTIRQVGMVMHGPNTTLANYNPLDPDEAGHEWKLSNVVNLTSPKVKDNSTTIRFEWKWRLI